MRYLQCGDDRKFVSHAINNTVFARRYKKITSTTAVLLFNELNSSWAPSRMLIIKPARNPKEKTAYSLSWDFKTSINKKKITYSAYLKYPNTRENLM